MTDSSEPLRLLEGNWKVSGTIRGRPVEQSAECRWTLGRQFLEVHFIGTTAPREGMPPYEARVFVGWDSTSNRYVSHWLDVFGARPSETLGFGSRIGGGFVLNFDYSGGAFRDTFVYDPKTASWRLLIEMHGNDDQWMVFADETLTRVCGDEGACR